MFIFITMPKPCSLSALYLIIFSIYGNIISAQTTTGFETISTEQGLSQGLINDILQDKDGFIWIATKGGLNRYDGYSFKIFTTDPEDTVSISSNAVSNLLEDSKGRLWAGTYDGGVNVYDKKTGQFLRIVHKKNENTSLSSNRIDAAMTELPDDRILLYPQGGRLSIISLPDSGTPVISTVNVPGNLPVLGIGKDDKGFVWVGLSDNTIYIFNPSTLSFELVYNGHQFTGLIERTGKILSAKFSQTFGFGVLPVIRTTLIDSTGRLRKKLLSNMPVGGLEFNDRYPFKPGMSLGCNIYDLTGVKKGDNINNGYACNLKTDVPDQNIKCLLLDRSGVLWVGTMGHGIYKYRIGSNRFTPLLNNMSLQRITAWHNGMLYVQGWRASKLLTPDGDERINPVASVVATAPAYIQVLQTRDSSYWVYWNVLKKLYRYSADLKLITAYNEPASPLPTEQLQPMIEDSKHHIWICGANGTLAKIDPVTGSISKFIIDIKQLTGTQALTQTNAYYEDNKGIFWLATEHGFARVAFADDGTMLQVKWFKNIPGNSNSLSYNYVSWFMDDPANADYLWICTKGGGLNRMQKSTGKFIHYTTKQGLPNDVVYGVLADNAGNIWGSTNKGLFCMLAGKKEEEPEFRLFSRDDGLQADEFNTNAFAKLTNGNLAFGGVNGLNIFNPQKVLSSNFTPNIFITNIQIGNKNITPGDKTGLLTETIEQTASITLTHLQDVVTLEFSSLDFSAPLRNKYRYQLSGIDNDWIESGTRRTATYLHLPAGNYVFKVQGSNSQGIWSNKIAELKIKVLPPWWKAWWAYMLYVLLIALAIRAYLRFNVNKAKLQSQLSYEQLEAKRAKELDTIKTQLYTNITHEFRTPLTVILGMARQVVEKPAEQFNTRMEMIMRSGHNLLGLVNQLLDLSKLETGKMQLQLSQGDVILFLRYIVESFHSLAESQQKQLHFLTDIDILYLEFDSEKLRQIISNLLSNAIRFTPEKGNIYISVLQNDVQDNDDHPILTIRVKDTGIGIPEDQLQFIFDRFYQLDNSHTRKTEGTGIGLALTKELVKLMDGKIEVKSPPAGAFKGSEFIVSLPLKKVATTEELAPGDLKNQTTHLSSILPVLNVPVTDSEDKNINTPLILLVEDNADVVAYTASCLTDYRLAVGKDGREGFDIATDIIPDLIITDVMMPYVDGFELVNKLRNNENTSHIPVIILTAKADAASKIAGLEEGADAYLEKPFNREELLVRIKKLLEMRKNLQQYYLKKAGIYEVTHTESVSVADKISDHAIEDSFVKKIREAVEQNLTDTNFTVEQLCKQIFMSHSQLHRKLEALTGYSPNKFIRMIRLKRAKELLQDPANSIASIALDCGYNDPGYFARVFKQEYGVTPQEWRATNRQ